MEDIIWRDTDYDLLQALDHEEYERIEEYSRSNQFNLFVKWINGKYSELRKSLRLGSALLHYFERAIQSSQKLKAVFRLGALLGTIESIEKKLIEHSQDQWVKARYDKELSSIKHFDEIIELLQNNTVLTHTELCEKMGLKTSTLTEAIKKVIDVGAVSSTPSGKYKLYSLTDEGRRLARNIHRDNLKNDKIDILEAFRNELQKVNDRDEAKRILESLVAETNGTAVFPGEVLKIVYNENGTMQRDSYYVQFFDIAENTSTKMIAARKNELSQNNYIEIGGKENIA